MKTLPCDVVMEILRGVVPFCHTEHCVWTSIHVPVIRVVERAGRYSDD